MADQHNGTLYFYREYEEPFGFLCQWYERTFVVDGTPYKCAEMYMMEQKAVTFGDEARFSLAIALPFPLSSCCFSRPWTDIDTTQPSRRAILRAPTPRKQKAFGRKVSGFDVKLWDERKYDVAVQGNMYKFSQAPDLKAKLLETGDRELVEAYPQSPNHLISLSPFQRHIAMTTIKLFANIHKASKFDRVWGIGFDAADAKRTDRECWGENLLGKALMEVRKRLQEQEDAAAAAAAADGGAEKEDPVVVATKGLQRHPPANPSGSRPSSSGGKKEKGKGKGKN